jgi:hypothetical protein
MESIPGSSVAGPLKPQFKGFRKGLEGPPEVSVPPQLQRLPAGKKTDSKDCGKRKVLIRFENSMGARGVRESHSCKRVKTSRIELKDICHWTFDSWLGLM